MFGPACISHDVMAVNKCNQLHSVTSATLPRSMLFFRIRTILVKKNWFIVELKKMHLDWKYNGCASGHVEY